MDNSRTLTLIVNVEIFVHYTYDNIKEFKSFILIHVSDIVTITVQSRNVNCVTCSS